MRRGKIGEEGGTVALNPGWSERYLGGGPDQEAALIRVFTEEIRRVQERNRRSEREPIRRAFHAKILVGVVNARFEVAQGLRPELHTPHFVPGASLPVVVRLSNASGILGQDDGADLRGIAVRVLTGEGGTDADAQDFLLTNAPASHARDARQFMAAAVAMAGGRRLLAIPALIRQLGLREAIRMLRALRAASSRPVASLATERFWSRAPFAIGPYAVKFTLHPRASDSDAEGAVATRVSLRDEFVRRLQRGEVRFALQVQHFVDERTTPIEDGTVEWLEADSPPETFADLVIPQQDLTTGDGQSSERLVDALAFSPWNASEGIRPIGSLNRARRLVYAASASLRIPGSSGA